MAEQGACDVRAKECKPCGRKNESQEPEEWAEERENLDGRIQEENKRQEVGDRWFKSDSKEVW